MRPNWFLACPLPVEAGWQAAASGAPEGLRRFAAEDLHLTVAFLGPCGAEAALRAWGRLADLRTEAIPVSAAGWRSLGPARRPSAYGLTLECGRSALVELLCGWGDPALEAAGLAPRQQQPLPHVTLLRPRRQEAEAVRAAMRHWIAAAPLPSATALFSELALYTWAEERQQRLFRIVERRPLAGEGLRQTAPCSD